jgi:hypothetical protein
MSTRDNTRVRSWRDIPAVKSAAGRPSANKPTAPAPPPRLKLTTAAAEAGDGAPSTKMAKSKGKKGSKKTAAQEATKPATATATAAASALMQRTPPETLKKKKETASLPENKKMIRHQQMTSLGVQTVQLLCIQQPPAAAQKKSSRGSLVQEGEDEEQQQNQVPGTAEENDGATTTAKPLASPRRQHATATTVGAVVEKKSKIKQRLKGTFYGSAQPPSALHPIRTVDDESDSDLDAFIETDDEEEEEEEDSDSDNEEQQAAGIITDNGNPGGDLGNQIDADTNLNNASDLYLSRRLKEKHTKPKKWKKALKEALNGYDASKFADVDAQPDRRMHATYEDILAEEARAGKIGREIDRIEAEKEAAARAAEKIELRERKRRQNVLIDDDSSSDDSDGHGDDVLSDSSDDEDEDEEAEDGGVEKHVRKRRKKLAGFLASF